ncbi:MAG: gnd, partial [Modestobacter sp.]|nr:gnd [Modestobacter sp.]
AALATIWRAGCIIRARFLDRIRQAFTDEPGLTTLLTHDYFRNAVAAAQEGWRRVVADAARYGIPAPGFASALAYYDGLRAERLPAALIQGLRDRFGSHTYRRVDADGAFHTMWSEDSREVSA